MKLLNTDEYLPPEGSLVYRQAVFGTVIGSIIFLLILASIPFFIIHLEFPVFFLVVTLLIEMLVIPVLLTTIVGACRKSNWQMVIESDGIWINLRSFTNYGFDIAPSVVCLEYRDIARVYSQVQEPDQSRDKFDSARRIKLLIELNLPDSTELRRAVKEENNRREIKKILFGLGTSSSKTGHSSVSIRSDDLMKVIWKGFNGSITIKPALHHALRELSEHVEVGEQVTHLPKVNDPNAETKQFTSDEENEVLELIQSGEKMSAIKLARKVYGFGLKEAKEFVEDFQET